MAPRRNLPKRNTDPSKDRYGVTEGPAPGIDALRGTLDPSQQAQLDAIVAFEVNRQRESRQVIEDQDQQLALNIIANHWAELEAAGNPAAAGPANTRGPSETPGTRPAPRTEEPNNPEGYASGVSPIGIHPEVPNTRINSYLVTAAHILSNRAPPAANVAQAHANAQSAYEIAHGVGDESMMARCQFYLGMAGLRSGSIKRALVHFQNALEVNPPYKEGTWARNWIVECEKIIEAKGDVSITTSVATSPTSSTRSQGTPQDEKRKKGGKDKGKGKEQRKAPAIDSNGSPVKGPKRKYTGKGKAPANGMSWGPAQGSEGAEGSEGSEGSGGSDEGSKRSSEDGPKRSSEDGPKRSSEDVPKRSSEDGPKRSSEDGLKRVSEDGSKQDPEEGSKQGPEAPGEGKRKDGKRVDSPRDTVPTSNSTTPEEREPGLRVFLLRQDRLDRERKAARRDAAKKPKPKPQDIARKKNTGAQEGDAAGASTLQQGSGQHLAPPGQPDENGGGVTGDAAAQPQPPSQPAQDPDPAPQAPPATPAPPAPPATPAPPPPPPPPPPPARPAREDLTLDPLAGINLLAYNAGAYTRENGQPAQTAAREALERELPNPFANERWEIGTPILLEEGEEEEEEEE